MWRGVWELSDVGDGPCCCPLGAVLVCDRPTQSRLQHIAAQDALGVSAEWIDGFFTGFDGYARSDQEFTSHDQRVGFALGAQLRHEYITNKEATDG